MFIHSYAEKDPLLSSTYGTGGRILSQILMKYNFDLFFLCFGCMTITMCILGISTINFKFLMITSNFLVFQEILVYRIMKREVKVHN